MYRIGLVLVLCLVGHAAAATAAGGRCFSHQAFMLLLQQLLLG